MTDVATTERATHLIAEAACETAFLALKDALACAFKALQDPACASLLGAVVPGATMAFGARVPGTSYQLDPVQAAFNIGTLVHWCEGGDEAFASDCGLLVDNLGAILAVADYRARKAIAEGVQPLTVGDLFTALIRAHEHASREWIRATRPTHLASPAHDTPGRASALNRCGLTRIASAAAATSLLGGSDEQRALAVAFARRESHELALLESPGGATGLERCERWQLGDATARGVRLALFALAERASPLRPAAAESEAAPELVAAPGCEQTWAAADPASGAAGRVHECFAAVVTIHFPSVQAARMVAMCANRSRLEALPINELVSMTVRN